MGCSRGTFSSARIQLHRREKAISPGFVKVVSPDIGAFPEVRFAQAVLGVSLLDAANQEFQPVPCQQNPGSLQLGYYLGDIEGKQKAADLTAGRC